MTSLELFGLLGGVGLFLYGMSIMSTGLRNACGEKLKSILEHATRNKCISVLVGIAVTILIQSSSATDVMVIGFVNSGLLNLSQAIGVILGANIGTTVTAQITAFNISAYAPLILFVGAMLFLFVGKPFVKHSESHFQYGPCRLLNADSGRVPRYSGSDSVSFSGQYCSSDRQYPYDFCNHCRCFSPASYGLHCVS